MIEQVKELRASGLTQAQIGARLGKSQAWVSSVLSGRFITPGVGLGKYPNRRRKHGHCLGPRGSGDSPTYTSWRAMRDRCSQPSHRDWALYGARGISVCDRWQLFKNFLADMGERPEGMTLDRIDSDGNYEPGNCRWATAKEQRVNQRRMVA